MPLIFPQPSKQGDPRFAALDVLTIGLPDDMAARCYDKMLAGAAKYPGEEWRTADLREHIRQEVLDLVGYCALMWARGNGFDRRILRCIVASACSLWEAIRCL